MCWHGDGYSGCACWAGVVLTAEEEKATVTASAEFVGDGVESVRRSRGGLVGLG